MQQYDLKGIKINAPLQPHYEEILSNEALEFLAKLHQRFNPRRLELLQKRVERQQRINAGEKPDFLSSTQAVRKDPSWKVAETPKPLQKRWVEITGPTDRKMMINAMNSGADVFMADFEDANTPTWDNLIQGHINIRDTIEGTISYASPEGKQYTLEGKQAILFVRPRGWHLNEKHYLIHDEEMSGSLFDAGLFLFHNAKRLLKQGKGPYLYLPKMESHLEARLWNDVFVYIQNELKIPQGSIRATVLIETILAAFEMEEILFELKDHSAGLNAGRWDYIFSIIKKFQGDTHFNFPDRSQITMTVPFMRAYTSLLVQTCHKRGAHAIGGMAAFVPNRKDPQVTEKALTKVREDKLREVKDGFDGTWVAHPGLVPVAYEVFEQALKTRSNQKDILREDVRVAAKELLDFSIPGGKMTEEGLKANVDVPLQYLASWLSGKGAVTLYNLMEDAATAEISRAQVWQWLHNHVKLSDGTQVTDTMLKKMIQEERDRLAKSLSEARERDLLEQAYGLFTTLVFSEQFMDFLTVPAYQRLK